MPFRTSRRVEFHQTDAAGIVHFASFLTMMESAEHELLRDAGLSVMPPPGQSPRLTWPRISVHCDYHNAARFEDQLVIDVTVEHIGHSSVRYRFDIARQNARDDHPADATIATGTLTAVCCDLSSGKLVKTDVPDDIRDRLRAYA